MPFVPSTCEFGQGVLPKPLRAFEHMPVRPDVDLHKGYVHLPFGCWYRRGSNQTSPFVRENSGCPIGNLREGKQFRYVSGGSPAGSTLQFLESCYVNPPKTISNP